MLILLGSLLAILAAPGPAPSPSDADAPSPLKEIGRVQSLSVCSAIVVHANSAIGAALDNDQDLAITINRLRTTELDDDNPIKRRNNMNDLQTLAGRMRTAAAAGNAEIKRLRAMAAQTTVAARKADLTAFSDALSGAIARQRKAAEDLDHALAIIDGRRAVEEVNTADLVGQRASIAGTNQPAAMTSGIGVMRNPVAPTSPSSVNGVLRTMADDYQSRAQAILSDEGVAADHSLGATTGC